MLSIFVRCFRYKQKPKFLTQMKRVTFILSLILGTGLLVSGSAAQTNRERLPALQNFEALHVGAAINVVISNAYRDVEIECSPMMFERLDIEVVNNVLNIGLRPGANIRSTRITVYLPMRAYRHIKAMSASRIDIQTPVTTENIIFEVSSAARLTGTVEANEVQIFANSTGRITLGGTANMVRVDASSSARVECRNLKSAGAVCTATSTARVTLHATRSFEGHASSTARIECYGNPTERWANTSSAARINFR